MSWIERLTGSLRPRKLEDDLDRELAFHLDMRTHEKIAAGADPDEARRDVMRRFGSVARTKEDCREQSTLGWLDSLRQDLRYAARNLWKSPGFTAAAVACLAIGIGANTVVFSFVNAFLFQASPPGVVRLGRASGNLATFPEWQEWQRFNTVFDQMFAYSMGANFRVGRGPASQEVLGETVAGDYFRALGVVPIAGRVLDPRDEQQPVAVIGYQLWHDRFRADPAIAGTSIWIENQAFTIVGVAPAQFRGMMAPWSTEIWATPALNRELLPDRRTGWLAVGAHLRIGVTPQQASASMRTLDAALQRQHAVPGRRAPDPLTVSRPGLASSPVWAVFLVMSALLMAIVGIIYLIACANVGGLLIARAAARRREILIRLSLGVSRPRLVRQLLTESLLLGLLAAAAGTTLALFAGNALATMFPQSISHGYALEHSIDLRVLAWTLTLAIASILFAGLLPALGASRQNLAAAGRTHTPSNGRTSRLRQFLIVAQVAASVLVLATAGAFIRSFQKSQDLKPGFDTAHLLTVNLGLRSLRYSPSQLQEFYALAKGAVTGLPSVESASVADLLPLSNERTLDVPDLGNIATATVDTDYFRTLGIPFLQGRQPEREDAVVSVVNQALSDRLTPKAAVAFGHVAGVVANSKYWSLAEGPRPFVYRISNRFDGPAASLAIRTRGPAADSVRAVGQAIQRLNPDLPAIAVQTGQERLRNWLEPQRAAALLLGVLGFAALALAITGLYGLLAQLLVQRTPEIAVRVALGASRAGVLALLLGQSAILVSAGTGIGIAAATFIARLLASGIGAIGTLDAPTLLAIPVLLGIVSALATTVPAYRALRIDPAIALRSE